MFLCAYTQSPVHSVEDFVKGLSAVCLHHFDCGGQFYDIGNDQFRRRRGSGCAQISDKIADCEIRLVADCRYYGNR